MPHTMVSISESIGCLMAVSVRPISILNSVDSDIAMMWIRRVTGFEVVDNKPTPASRDGEVIFNIGNNPRNVVTVRLSISRILTIGKSETWVGRHVHCYSAGASWSWSYSLDWKSGEIVQPDIKIGNYPYAHIRPV